MTVTQALLQSSGESNAVIEFMVDVWTWIMQDTIAAVIALALGGYAALLLYQRSMSTDDPSISVSIRTFLGSYSLLKSGAFAIVALLGGVALVTWPAPVETPLLGGLLVGGVLYAAGMEYVEYMEEGA